MQKRRVVRHEVVQPPDQSYRLIPLTQGQNAIVDVEDFEWLSQWNWHAMWTEYTRSFRAIRNEGKKAILMHRVILGCEGKEEGDHRNHNSLDNRRHNLRKCTRVQNMCNKRPYRGSSSKFKGVSFNKSKNKWVANIQINGKQTYLKSFNSEEQAARAYDEAAKIHHGVFARLNFPNHPTLEFDGNNEPKSPTLDKSGDPN